MVYRENEKLSALVPSFHSGPSVPREKITTLVLIIFHLRGRPMHNYIYLPLGAMKNPL